MVVGRGQRLAAMKQRDSLLSPFPPGNFAEFWPERVTRLGVGCVSLWRIP